MTEHGYSPGLPPAAMRLLAKEIGTLKKSPPEGITIHPNEADMTDIQATIDGPDGTPYAGGVFRIKLVISRDFPAEPPKGFFLTTIFHPNVASSGEICVNTLKKDWKEEYGLQHILLTVKCLLIVPNPESALNEEAGRLLLEQYDDYFARAKLFTRVHATPQESRQENIEEAQSPSKVKKVAADGKVQKQTKGARKALRRL